MFICTTMCHPQSTSMRLSRPRAIFHTLQMRYQGSEGSDALQKATQLTNGRTGTINLVLRLWFRGLSTRSSPPPPRCVLLSYNTQQGCVQGAWLQPQAPLQNSSRLLILRYGKEEVYNPKCPFPHIPESKRAQAPQGATGRFTESQGNDSKVLQRRQSPGSESSWNKWSSTAQVQKRE